MPGLLDLIAARNPEQAGGLLSDLVAAPRNRLRGLLENPIGFANDALQEGLFGPPEVRAARDKFWNKEPMTDLEKQAYTNQLLNMGMAGLTVYHGSPHKFDKFDMSKIGSGEGAQAYGHGLYFAESPEVAKSYLKAGGGANQLTVTLPNKQSIYGDQITDKGLEAIKYLEMGAKDAGKFKHNTAYYAKKRTQDPEIQKLIDEWKDAKIGYQDHSTFYKVDLPDESIAKMLDWDKPLSQQAPEVQRAIGANVFFPDSMTGREVYEQMAAESFKKQGLGADHNAYAAEFFRNKLGIPGIRYLDGGSRNAGQGTYNYVVFDDALPTILERNGQKLK